MRLEFALLGSLLMALSAYAGDGSTLDPAVQKALDQALLGELRSPRIAGSDTLPSFNLDRIGKLIDQGAALSQQTFIGEPGISTVPMAALPVLKSGKTSNSVETLDLLLSKGATLPASTGGHSILFQAIFDSASDAMIARLLELPGVVQTINEFDSYWDRNSLQSAFYHGSVSAIRLLVSSGGDPLLENPQSHENILHFAARTNVNSAQMWPLAIELVGKDRLPGLLSSKDISGETPIDIALEGGNLDVLESVNPYIPAGLKSSVKALDKLKTCVGLEVCERWKNFLAQ